MTKMAKIKAEDILAKEDFSEEKLSGNANHEEGIDENELKMANHIYSFLVSSSDTFPAFEKEQTKNQIKSSIRKQKWAGQFKRWPAAAVVLLVCCIAGVWYFSMDSTPEITRFAQTLVESRADSDTRLILQDGEEVKINKAESQISYAQNGENIMIGADRKVAQKITLEKPTFNTVIVPYGKRTRITLSEGTKIWLNSGSKLIYPAVFADNKRHVYIDGEAIFEVTPSKTKPFQVSTRDFKITVLGTIFNVCAYSDDKYSSTVLERGKVELSYKINALMPREKLTISPGTLAVFDPEKERFQEQQVNPQNYMSWREGFLVFDREKLSTILKMLGRYYNVEVLLQNSQLGNETFSGKLDLKNTPEEVLDVIAETTPFIYHSENGKLIINPK